MLLLATQAEPQMVEHAHPNLGRLIQPRHYNALPATIARGVPWAADNDCFQRLDAHAYYAMLDRLHHIGGRCLFVAVPDVMADAYATARQFERWWTGAARRGLPVALVAQDGLEHMGRWMSMVWPRIDALFVGGSTEWKLGPAARAFVREAKRRGLWVHMGRVNRRQAHRLRRRDRLRQHRRHRLDALAQHPTTNRSASRERTATGRAAWPRSRRDHLLRLGSRRGRGLMWVRDDGGRQAAGFKGATGDCVVRAIAIAGELPYAELYDALHLATLADPWLRRKLERRYGARAPVHASPRAGVHRRVYDRYLIDHGWTWTPTMKVGQGCTVHLRAEELPSGRLIVRVSRHMCAVIDGVIHDTHDPSREGTRCVYGYWSHPTTP